MLESRHPLTKSFGYAFGGLRVAFTKGRNYKIQALIGVLVIFFGFFVRLPLNEWIVIVLTIAFVLVLELINTSLEAIVDLVSPEIKEKAKIAKDVAAGAVLISSIAAIVIGVLIFLPKILGISWPE